MKSTQILSRCTSLFSVTSKFRSGSGMTCSGWTLTPKSPPQKGFCKNDCVTRLPPGTSLPITFQPFKSSTNNTPNILRQCIPGSFLHQKFFYVESVGGTLYQNREFSTLQSGSPRARNIICEVTILQKNVFHKYLNFFPCDQVRCRSSNSHKKVGDNTENKSLRRGKGTHSGKSTLAEKEVKGFLESTAKDTETEQNTGTLTLYQRFKKTYKEHGKVLIGVHLATSAIWFGSFYTAARCGIDLVPYLESWNFSERLISPFRSGGLGDVALAYLMYKLATPARYTVTIGGTNIVIRYLRKEGKMEPVPEGNTLRELYKEGKADFKSKSGERIRRMRRRVGRVRVKRSVGKDRHERN